MHKSEGLAFFKDGVLHSSNEFADSLNLNLKLPSLAVADLVIDGSQAGVTISGYRNTLLYCDETGKVVPYVDDNETNSMKLNTLEVVGTASAQAMQVQQVVECDTLKTRTVNAGNIESSGSVSASKVSSNAAKHGALEITGETVLQTLNVHDSIKSSAIDTSKFTAETMVVRGASEFHTVRIENVLTTSSLVLSNDVTLNEYDSNHFLTVDTKGAVRSITMDTLAANIPLSFPKQAEFDTVDVKNELITKSIQLTIPNQQGNFLHIDKNNRVTPSAALKLSNDDVMITSSKFHVNGMTDLIGATYVEGSLNVHGSVVGSGPYMDSSDIRFKTNIKNITGLDALTAVIQLRPVVYDHITDQFPFLPSGHQIGFIADEIEHVIPDIVSKDDQGYKAIAYSRISAINTGAIQELYDKINKLENQVRKLTEIIEKMVA